MPKKVVLAYSGGLDTSVILHWIRETYDAEVVTYTGDVGQGPTKSKRRGKAAESTGADEIVVEDLREAFVQDDDLSCPACQCHLRVVLP